MDEVKGTKRAAVSDQGSRALDRLGHDDASEPPKTEDDLVTSLYARKKEILDYAEIVERGNERDVRRLEDFIAESNTLIVEIKRIHGIYYDAEQAQRVIGQAWVNALMHDFTERSKNLMGKAAGKETENPAVELPPVAEFTFASSDHSKNQDSLFSDARNGIFGVFDGIGGHAAGDIAAYLAKQILQIKLQELSIKLSLDDTVEGVRQALVSASDKIVEIANKVLVYRGMGTTASVVKLWRSAEGKQWAVVGNSADSRVYLYRDGRLEQVTLDDSLVRNVGRNEDGILNEAAARAAQKKLSEVSTDDDLNALNDRELIAYRTRNQISNQLGGKKIVPNIYTVELRPGDKLLLTTDGIHDNLTDTEIEREMKDASLVEVAAKTILSKTLERANDHHHIRNKMDDASAILIEIPELNRATPASSQGQSLREGSFKKTLEQTIKLDEVYRVRYAHYMTVMNDKKYQGFPDDLKREEADKRAKKDMEKSRKILTKDKQ